MKTDKELKRQSERALKAALKDMKNQGLSFPKALYQHFQEGNDIENPGFRQYKPKFR